VDWLKNFLTSQKLCAVEKKTCETIKVDETSKKYKNKSSSETLFYLEYISILPVWFDPKARMVLFL
jgi:hypothetical protein